MREHLRRIGEALILMENPHIRFLESRERGYVLVKGSPKLWRTDLRVVDTITQPEASARTLRSYVGRVRQSGTTAGMMLKPPSQQAEPPLAEDVAVQLIVRIRSPKLPTEQFGRSWERALRQGSGTWQAHAFHVRKYAILRVRGGLASEILFRCGNGQRSLWERR
jgi:hypothetical protein